MTLELSQLEELRDGPATGSIQVGELPSDIARQIGAWLPFVYLSREYLLKILKKPNVSIYDLLRIPFMLKDGMVIADRADPRRIVICYQAPDRDVRFKTVVKVAGTKSDLWITTFHRTKPRQTKALLERGRTLRRHR